VFITFSQFAKEKKKRKSQTSLVLLCSYSFSLCLNSHYPFTLNGSAISDNLKSLSSRTVLSSVAES